MNKICLYLFAILFLTQCIPMKMMEKKQEFPSDEIILEESEKNAVFLAINHVDILHIKGMEFYHLFMIILLDDPTVLEPDYIDRASLFYDVNTRDFEEDDVSYFEKSKWMENSLWETTISASSECAYDMTKDKLGNLTKVPNFDRIDNDKSGKRVFVKKIASNNLAIVRQILEYEHKYDNSLKYSLIPETSKNGYNSNSYFRGALEYAGLIDSLEVPNCFKSPGLSKAVSVDY